MRLRALIAALLMMAALLGCNPSATTGTNTAGSNKSTKVTHTPTDVFLVVLCAKSGAPTNVEIVREWQGRLQNVVTDSHWDKRKFEVTATVDNIKKYGYVLQVTGCGSAKVRKTAPYHYNNEQIACVWKRVHTHHTMVCTPSRLAIPKR